MASKDSEKEADKLVDELVRTLPEKQQLLLELLECAIDIIKPKTKKENERNPI